MKKILLSYLILMFFAIFFIFTLQASTGFGKEIEAISKTICKLDCMEKEI